MVFALRAHSKELGFIKSFFRFFQSMNGKVVLESSVPDLVISNIPIWSSLISSNLYSKLPSSAVVTECDSSFSNAGGSPRADESSSSLSVITRFLISTFTAWIIGRVGGGFSSSVYGCISCCIAEKLKISPEVSLKKKSLQMFCSSCPEFSSNVTVVGRCVPFSCFSIEIAKYWATFGKLYLAFTARFLKKPLFTRYVLLSTSTLKVWIGFTLSSRGEWRRSSGV